VKVEESIEIRRPVKDVFAFATDPGKWPSWASAFQDIEGAPDGAPKVGDVFRATATFMGRDVATSFEVTDVRPPNLFAYRAVRGPVPGDFRWSFTEAGTGTRFHFSIEGKPSGLAKMIAPMAAPAVKSQIHTDLDRLKEILEAGSSR